MANEFYTASGSPGTRATLASAAIRAEFALIVAGFGLLPTMAGNGLKLVRVNTGGTALEATNVLPALGAALDLGSTGQINFPATQNPSAGANVMDDYEEGTFSPTIAGAGTAGAQTYSVQFGKYTKVGNAVHVAAGVTLTAKDGTTAGGLEFRGLPFTSSSSTNIIAALAVGAASTLVLDAGFSQFICSVNNNSTAASMAECGNNVAQQALVAANLAATSGFRVAGTYFV